MFKTAKMFIISVLVAFLTTMILGCAGGGGTGGGSDPVPTATTTTPVGSISGTVVDNNQAAIRDAKCVLLTTDHNVVSETITDKEGNFSFEEIEVGTYLLEISKSFMGSITLEVVVVENQNADVSITLGKTGNVVLTVTDSHGEPAEGAAITLSRSSSKMREVFNTITNNDGEATITNVPIGDWTLTGYKNGVGEFSTSVTVNDGETTNVPPELTVLSSTPTPSPTVSPSPTPTVSPSPSPTTSPVPNDGYLDLATSPTGASIEIDGSNSGYTTPHIFSLSPGSHIYKVSLDGYNSFEERIDVFAEQTVTRVITLTPVTNLWTLKVIALQAGTTTPLVNATVSVWQDGVEYKKSTDSNGAATFAKQFETGTVDIVIRKSGWESTGHDNVPISGDLEKTYEVREL